MPHYRAAFSETLNIGATIRSFALEVPMGSLVCYAVRAPTPSTGTLTVQYSNDFIPGFQPGSAGNIFAAGDDPSSDAKWDTFPLVVNPPAFAGSALTFPIQVSSASMPFYPFRFVRLKFTFTSGSGSLFYAANIKG